MRRHSRVPVPPVPRKVPRPALLGSLALALFLTLPSGRALAVDPPPPEPQAPPPQKQEAPVAIPGGFLPAGSASQSGPAPDTGKPDTTAPAPAKSDKEELIEGIAAQVGNGVVLVSEVRRLAAPIEARMRKAHAPESQIREMRSEALERLIEQRLIEDIVKRAQLTATDAEIDQAIAAIAKENGLTLEQMSKSIASHGLTVDEYRAKIKSEIERNKVLGSMVRSKVTIDDAEVRALYDQKYGNQRDSGPELHLRHLLVAVAAEKMRDETTACRMASDIRKQVTSGKLSFQQAAQRYSDTNAERGGDLGWVHADELAAWMAPAVANLQAGQVSDVIPMYFGCNLLQVVERRQFHPVTFEQAKPALEQALFQQKMEKEYTAWIDKLREQVYIQRHGVYAEADRVASGSKTR